MSRKGYRRTKAPHKLSPLKPKPKHQELTTKDERLYTFFAYLTFSKTVCTLHNIPKSVKIRDFKEHLVLVCGVPYAIQRLHYLDSCELKESDDLHSLDIPDNASFRLSVWSNYEKLMRCVHEDDLDGLLTCGVIETIQDGSNDHEDTKCELVGTDIKESVPNVIRKPEKVQSVVDIKINDVPINEVELFEEEDVVSETEDYVENTEKIFGNITKIVGNPDNIITNPENIVENPNKLPSIRKLPTKPKQIITDKTRVETALFVAAYLGRYRILERLLELGTNVNCTTRLGYTPLHAAVACGHYKCIDYLLEKGATCDTKSTQAKKAMVLAKMNNFHESERHLHSFEWQTRAKKLTKSTEAPLMMHQQFDSKNPIWLNGEYSTRYIASTLPRSKFSGTRIDSPLSKLPKTSETRKKYTLIPDLYNVPEWREENGGKHVSFGEDTAGVTSSKDGGLSFDTWLRNKKQQKIISMQQQEEEEKLRLREKQEKERTKKSRKLTFYEEQKKRKSRINDDYSDRNKVSMYEDHKYLPNYQTSIIHHYMNELMLDTE